ncbi:1-aminocyclopropane-1-carboxylate deaminase/D-cysteine desulfhydrase [Anditalea andensis]|uniref:1-aminocyclopropane-1-carboxylate deaminase n=1 Tax=Anditalea andensis TaxID=1048983 RepID=A0A074KY35_9BACT|nr:pyridoxal-phosphate dependent enzyme [Anditalea andensis]KEO73095.1 1-aminocyclopropane-1-carboxylate deaminase [Anditalea andensis]
MLEKPNISYTRVSAPVLERKNIQLIVKRLDLIHPLISGNKFFKLKYNMKSAQKAGYKQLLTFGGAYSNHIHAAAAAAKIDGLSIIGVIRGEKTLPLNPTLQMAQDSGMKIHYVSRSEYRNKAEPEFITQLQNLHGDFYLIPEGGTNSLAIEGTKEILQGEDFDADIITCSIGTGGTLAGIVTSAKEGQKIWGFSSLKGSFILKEFEGLLTKENLSPTADYEIFTNYHFGGYGKHKPELLSFIRDFYDNTGIPLDPIYTGKMMYGVFDKVDQIQEGTKILCLHTGGLQGITGFNSRYGTDLPLK